MFWLGFLVGFFTPIVILLIIFFILGSKFRVYNE